MADVSILSYTSDDGIEESLSWSVSVDPDVQSVEGCEVEQSGDPLWTTLSPNHEGYSWTNSNADSGKALSRRVSATVSGETYRSGTVLLLQAPPSASSFSAEKSGYDGVLFSWTVEHPIDAYEVRIYEGFVDCSSGKPDESSAKLLGAFQPSQSSAEIKGVFGAYSEKTFSVAVVSSYESWTRSDKQSFASAGIFVDGFSSDPSFASLENGFREPSAAVGVSLTNDLGGEKVSDSVVRVSFSLPEADEERPVSGWRLYSGDNMAFESQDVSSVSGQDVDIDSIKGKSVGFSVALFGIGGETKSSKITLRGTLFDPEISAQRDGYSLWAEADSEENSYAFAVQMRVTLPGKQSQEYVEGEKLTDQEGILESAFFEARCIPDDGMEIESHASGWSRFELLGGATPVKAARAWQDNDSFDDGPHCVVEWSRTEDSEGYVVSTVENGLEVEKASVGKMSSSANFPWWSDPTVTVVVRSVRNGWRSEPFKLTFYYSPPFLEPPFVLSVEKEDGYRYKARFRHATGGNKIDGTSYRYSVYIGGKKVDWQYPSPDDPVEATDSPGEVSFNLVSPRAVWLKMTATDADGESGFSNSVAASYQAGDVGVFAFQCDGITISECSIEGAMVSVQCADGTEISLSDCDLSTKDGGRPYEIDADSSVFETNVKITEG